jgi:cell division protein FtsB
MQYQQAKHLKPAEFKRFWGVKLETFKQMVEIVRQHESTEKENWTTWKNQSGRPNLDDIRVLARIPHLFPYRSILGSNGIYGLSNNSESREEFKSSESFHSARKEASLSDG